MEVKEASDHELTFDVQNYEVGHEHLWDVLKEFDGKGRKGRIELEYTDHDKHLYPCAAYQLNVLQDSASIEGKDFRMALGRIELKLGKEVHWFRSRELDFSRKACTYYFLFDTICIPRAGVAQW